MPAKVRFAEAIHRASAWFSAHPELITSGAPAVPALPTQVAALATVSANLTQLSVTQSTQLGQATLAARDEPSLHHNLRTQHIAPIVKMAFALKATVPGISLLKTPAADLRSAALVKAADAFASTTAIYKDVLIEHGLPSDFLDQLRTAIDALRSSLDARSMAKSAVVAATENITSNIAAGRNLTTMLDASLTHVLKSDPAMLKAWRQAKRVPAKGSTASVTATPAPSVATPAPAAPVAASPAPVVGSPSA